VQGAVLSVPLFLIGMEHISKDVNMIGDEITKVSFADDLTIAVKGKNLCEVERMAQEVIDYIDERASEVGYI
jgi:hypothetical protein